MSQKSRFKMQLQGTLQYRWTFPQLPWGTVENPTYIQTEHGCADNLNQCDNFNMTLQQSSSYEWMVGICSQTGVFYNMSGKIPTDVWSRIIRQTGFKV